MLILRAVKVLQILLLCSLFGLAYAADGPPANCDSCRIQIDSLDKPISMVGNWQFTRDDNPANKDVSVDTSNWVVVKAPGSWKGAYPDKKVFPVGWYRGTFQFAPALIGQEVVFRVDPVFSPITVYVDGTEIWRRPGDIHLDRYYTGQPIPVRFKVTQKEHVIAFRIESWNMRGVGQIPFELRKFDTNDADLTWSALLGGEFRMMTGAVTMLFGAFFFLVYSKTRASMYLMAALSATFIGYFFVMQTDMMMRLMPTEMVIALSQFGGIGLLFSWYFSQHFYKQARPSVNWVAGVFGVAIASYVPATYFLDVDLATAIKFRALSVQIAGLWPILTLYQCVQGMRHKRPGAAVLTAGMGVMLVCTIHDLLVTSSVIVSQFWGFVGVTTWIAAMLYVASNIYGNTFRENRRLVVDLKGLNDNLENIVTERTAQLREKSKDIRIMLENLPQGVLTVVDGDRIHHEYSAYLEQIFDTKDIANRNVMDLVFSNTNLGADLLSQVEATISACIGEDEMNYEFNAHLLVTECDKDIGEGRAKSLELSWSPIANDDGIVDKLMLCVRDVTELKKLAKEAGQQKRELEIIGQILGVNQEKFQEFVDSAGNFVAENEKLIVGAGVVPPGQINLDVVSQLFRNMHTIKGNARTYGLLHLTNLVHEAEQAYDELRKNPEAVWNGEKLLEQLHAVQGAIAEYTKINEVKLGRKGPGRRGGVDKFLMVQKDQIEQALDTLNKADPTEPASLAEAIRKVRNSLELIGTQPIGAVLLGVTESLPSLAKELNKDPPVSIINDNGIVIRNQVADLIRNVFMHLYRNSMDHGIETADSRIAQGKTAAGHIWLDVSLTNDELMFKLKDDGKGLAVGYIRKKAIEKGLIAVDQKASPEEIAQLIFAAGFSTAAAVTEVSGRGVGMDAVKSFVERENGRIELAFTTVDTGADFRPFETVICLPAKFGVRVRT